jgi:small subunit ribosomal protein S20
MANHKSAEKAHARSLKNRAINNSVRSRIKTFTKKVEAALTQNDKNVAVETMRVAESEIMKGVTKGVLKLNTAARKVSRLTHRVKAIQG